MPKLAPFGPEIWSAEGPVVSFFSYPYSTRMAVIRLSNGTLFAWSPIALDDALRAEVDALGEVAHVVSPNCFHHFWLADWKKAYPGARLYAPPRLDRRRRDLKFDAKLGDRPEAAWAGDIDQVAMQGNIVLTEIVFLHRPSRTAMFADLLQNFPRDWFKGWRGVLARWDGLVSPNYGAPRELRVTFWWRKLARQSLQRILDFAPERVFLAHGEMALENGTEFIRKGFRWLLG
jgi:hypothetical protein